MGCCIAIALVIGAVRTAWFKLVPSRAPVQMAFAPPARRPAPGAEVRTDRDRRPPLARPAAPVPSRGSSWTQGLVALAFALGAYAATMALASGAGLIESSRPVGAWLAFAVTLTAAATVVVGITGRAPARGTGLIIAGVAWLVASELDAHALHVVAHSDVLHAPGPIAVAIGLALRGGLAPVRLVPRPHSSLRPGATQ